MPFFVLGELFSCRCRALKALCVIEFTCDTLGADARLICRESARTHASTDRCKIHDEGISSVCPTERERETICVASASEFSAQEREQRGGSFS